MNDSVLAASDQNLVWIDLEMTGLYPATDRIIEIAVVVTDPQLTQRVEGPVFAVHQSDATLDAMLGMHCPNVLFPYARQAIGELVSQGGFPPFYLQPINFEALYAEGLRRRAEAAQGGAVAEAGTA